ETADGRVRVETDDEAVTECAGLCQIRHVAAVKDVEAAVREHDSFAPRASVAPDQLRPRENLLRRIHGGAHGAAAPFEGWAVRMASRIGPAPCARSCCASAAPAASGSSIVPVSVPRITREPSSAA